MDPSKPLLPPLLARGDVVEVVRGVLTITPASGLLCRLSGCESTSTR
ncbi:hypothetical protein [Microbulbifer taiwanensis]